jgi:hypothetical protein
MRYVSFALLCEGSTDAAALPPLIDKAVLDLIRSDDARAAFDWMIHCSGDSSDDTVQSLVSSKDYDILIVHRDAGSDAAGRRSRIAALGGVPLVPVRELEAWLIVDPNAFCRAANVPLERLPGGLPVGRAVERELDPKAVLSHIIETIHRRPPRGGRHRELEQFLEIVANEVDYAKLRALPAFSTFLSDLRSALHRLGWR